jgi:uncharacterized protein (TIGR03067 family)
MKSLLLGVALGIGAPGRKEPPPKTPPLIGRWIAAALTINGKADPQWNGLEYEFTPEGAWVICRDGKDIGAVVRSYKANPKARPAAIDVCEQKDGTSEPATFKIDADILFLSIRTEGGDRPTDFEPASGIMTFRFTRVKKD